jgi:hypothetical protein
MAGKSRQEMGRAETYDDMIETHNVTVVAFEILATRDTERTSTVVTMLLWIELL